MLSLRQSLQLNIIITVIILFCNHAQCAEKEKEIIAKEGFFTEASLITGYGSSNIPEGKYQPVLLAGHFGIDLKKYFSELENHRGTLSFYIEPQFNPAVKRETDFECGVGMGIQYMHPFTDRLSLYLMVGVGPHYISVVTGRQSNGFLFSDTIGAGMYHYITKNSAIIAGYRFRHLSNAHFGEPNGGINTHFATIGYSVFFK